MLYPTKQYPHFDNIISYNKVKNYVENPNKISSHSFFPFIKFIKKFERFDVNIKLSSKNKRPIEIKERPIMYASHIDNFIYKYYGEKLNDKYNQWVRKNGIDKCVTAYRNNKSGKSNIHYAAEVISFIENTKESYIMIGDYKGFFDSLNHKYLKSRIEDILNSNKLPLHYYKIYKSITKYSYILKEKINLQLGSDGKIKERLKKESSDKWKKNYKYFSTNQEFRIFKKGEDILNVNEKNYGIPQGTAISAVLANVYMIKIDKKIKDFIIQKGGEYRRYSDDFIIVLPKQYNETINYYKDFYNIVKEVKKLIEDNGLTLEEDKTKLLEFTGDKILSLKSRFKTRLDYLGFIFDGKNISIRQKSIYKFYRNAYKLIDMSKKKSRNQINKTLIYKRKIYSLYTDMGQYTKFKYRYKRKYHGNFIIYVKRAEIIFDKTCNSKSLMMNQIKNRKKKIIKRIKNK
ncbi:reverse transcriptase/maturase family protein [Clostridium tyrobutyricum]|uniref:reverse transcriptase/maturase family protein n=1 Tax=Clostridium tyrobutyricum TaxID=1519 RepID=UPI000306A084|nr:reverse transcriptase/maturase family protein [Clostridium tyrobutyricum]